MDRSRVRRLATRVVLGILVLTVITVVAVATWLRLRPLRLSPLWPETFAHTPERIERGRYLAWHVALCIECHSQRDFTQWSAPPIRGTIGAGGEHFHHGLGFPGDVWVSNITPDRNAGVGAWTDSQLVRAIREGGTPAGEALAPIMPFYYFHDMTDEDARSVVSYLRTLPAIASGPRRERRLDLILALLVRSAPRPAGIDGRVAELPHDDIIARGRYLSTLASCVWCHSPQRFGRVIRGREYAGGMVFRLPNGLTVTSPNLTPDATGLGRVSEETFLAYFHVRRPPDGQHDVAPSAPGTPLLAHNTVMPWVLFSGMTDDDLRAIYRFLRTVPPIANVVAR